MILSRLTGKRVHKPNQSRNQILNVHIGLILNGCHQDGRDSPNQGNQRLLPRLRVDHSHHLRRRLRLNRKKRNLGKLRHVHGRNTVILSGISFGNSARHDSRNPQRTNVHRLKPGYNVKPGSNAPNLWATFIPSIWTGIANWLAMDCIRFAPVRLYLDCWRYARVTRLFGWRLLEYGSTAAAPGFTTSIRRKNSRKDSPNVINRWN